MQVLNLEWSSGAGALKCIGRADIPLAGSFADMILLSGGGAPGGNQNADVFVLTNPGKLHLYDRTELSNLMSMSHQEGKATISGLDYKAVIPMLEPFMTAAKLVVPQTGECLLKDLVAVKYLSVPHLFIIPDLLFNDCYLFLNLSF